MASSTLSLHEPEPEPEANASATPEPAPGQLNDVPPLTTFAAETTEDKVEALRLVADSVAQQRQLASKELTFHPIPLAIAIALLAVVGQYLYDGTDGSYGVIATTYVGLLMAGLLTIRWAASGYIDLAEKTGTWAWLIKDSPPGKEDEILITKFGDDPIGALVMRGVKDVEGGNSGGQRKRRQNSGGGGRMRGEIRAWTVKTRYRRKGIGQGLLEEAVKLCRTKGWTGPVFAREHANSVRLLHPIFNRGFDKREKKARAMLERVVDESGGSPVSTGGRGKGRR